MIKRLFVTILFLVTLLVTTDSYSRTVYEYEAMRKRFDSSKYTEQIQEIEGYLSGFDTLKSRFSQVSPGQAMVSYGDLYISRPGKARWKYKEPVSLLMIINGDRFSYYDEELDQITYADVPATPLKILLHKDIKLSGDINIVDIKDEAENMEVTLSIKKMDQELDNEDLLDEYITLVFDKNPMQLTRLHRTNYNSITTTINLINPKYNRQLDEELFVFKNPKFFKNKRKK